MTDTRTTWTHAKQPDEEICNGCGKLCVRNDLHAFTAPNTDAGITETATKYDYDHETLGILVYCDECRQHLDNTNTQPGNHPLYLMRRSVYNDVRVRGDDSGESEQTGFEDW